MKMGTDQSERTMAVNNFSGHTCVYWLNISPRNVAGALAAILDYEARSQSVRMAELKERRHLGS